MREAELKRTEAMMGNAGIFYVGVIGALLILAVMYFLTQSVVGATSSKRPIPVGKSQPTTDGSHNGGAILITPSNSDYAATVYFS